jgi:hypothetical protein
MFGPILRAIKIERRNVVHRDPICNPITQKICANADPGVYGMLKTKQTLIMLARCQVDSYAQSLKAKVIECTPNEQGFKVILDDTM